MSWTQRKFYPDRTCFCGTVFTPEHWRATYCSLACINAAKRRQDKNRDHHIIVKAHKPAAKVVDWNDRGNRQGWKAYMIKNPFYFAALYPKHDLAGAITDMRRRGAL